MHSLIKPIELSASRNRSSVEVLVLFALVPMILFRPTTLGGAMVAIANRVAHTFVPPAPWLEDRKFFVALKGEQFVGSSSSFASNSSIGPGEMQWT